MHWSKNPLLREKTILKIKKNRTGKGLHTDEWKKEATERMLGNTNGFQKGHKKTEKWLTMMSLKMTGNTYGFKKGNHVKTEWKKGMTPWNKNKIGVMPEPWNKNKTGVYSEESIDKIRKGVILHLQTNALKQDTGIELKMQEVLNSSNITHEHPYSFNDKFLCDFAIPSLKIIIECDGDYWHNREDIKNRDKAKNAYITKCGWKMLRFWEHAINENIEECLEKILLEMKRKSELIGDYERRSRRTFPAMLKHGHSK